MQADTRHLAVDEGVGLLVQGLHLNVKDRLEPGDAAPLLRLLNRDVRGLATGADADQLDRALKAEPAAGFGHRLQHGGIGVDAAVHAPVFAPRGRDHARRGEERRCGGGCPGEVDEAEVLRRAVIISGGGAEQLQAAFFDQIARDHARQLAPAQPAIPEHVVGDGIEALGKVT